MYIDDSAKEKFSKKVLQRVTSTELTFMECIIELSDEMGIDPGTAGKLLTKPIIEKIQQEAKEKHLLKGGKTKKLPID
jgi:hypothetical protein